MQIIAIDTETALIRPGRLAPEMVCLTWATVQGAHILSHVDAEARLREFLSSGEYSGGTKILVGHNVAYDMAVICQRYPSLRPLVFKAYEENRVTDTGVRQKLLDIAGGVYRGRVGEKGRWIKHEYSLEALSRRCVGVPVKKEGFRLFYGPFRNVLLNNWPLYAFQLQERGKAFLAGQSDSELSEIRTIIADDKKFAAELAGMISADASEVTTYPLDDASVTLAIYNAQEKHVAYLADQFRQTRGEFWLHLSSAWGLRTDKIGVDALKAETKAAYDALEGELRTIGLIKKDGVRDTKAAKARMVTVCKEENLEIRRTDAHADPEAKCKDVNGKSLPPGDTECAEHVCLDADACGMTGDFILKQYADVSTLKKVMTNDCEMLARGTFVPVHTRYGMAESGRTTSSGPNIQNLRRLPGIREAFVPREGRIFAQADYPQLELYTLAQCCVTWLGESKLADAINSGMDPHLEVAAQILGTDYEDAERNLETDEVQNARQIGKVLNFGKPGGLGLEKLVLFAKKTYNVELTVPRAKDLIAKWYAAWPEMPHYFARVNALCDNEQGKAVMESLFTGRSRGNASYCQACNNGFQALGADCAKSAGWLICKAQYADSSSPLFNSRTVAFIHDEFILEVADNDKAHDAASELVRLMVNGANKYLPDVPMKISRLKPLLMRRWSKKAKPVFEKGRLIPWQ